jgi:4-amino-4-deoxy-L-arabinose transferase-like glycosyltransferase
LSGSHQPHQLDTPALLAGLIILICLFSHLGALGLVGPDEPRYAWIAREMASSGDWITPRLYGTPWFEKPALYYWAAAIGFRLHLPPEWAARLPSAFAALISAIVIGWLGWRQGGIDALSFKSPALLAPLLFSSSVAAVGFARAGSPDMLFTAALTLTMASAANVLFTRGHLHGVGVATARSANCLPLLILFGGSLGLAVLAKGPAGVILAGGAIGLWALATGSWRGALPFVHPVALISFCIIALPWYILCALRNPDFLRVFILEHNFNRYLTPVFQHPQPVWFFLVIIVLGILPWSGLLWGLGKQVLRSYSERSWKDSSELFLAYWTVFPLVFFSFSKSKLPGYVLPSFPPLALLLAFVLSRRRDSEGPPSRWIEIALGLTWIALGISTKFWLRRLPNAPREIINPSILVLEIVVVVAGVAIIVMGTLRKRGAIVLSLLILTILVEFVGFRILPALDPFLSARTYGKLLQQDRRPDRIFTFHVSRSWNFGLSFYLHRKIREWTPEDPQAALVLTTPPAAVELEKLGRFRGPIEEGPSGNLLVPVLPSSR